MARRTSWRGLASILAAACLVAAACGGPAQTAARPATTWERLDPVPDSREGPGRILAAGPLLVGTGDGGPWISEDGRGWIGAEVDGPAGAVIAAVAPGGPGFVGVGRVATASGARPMTFTSIDGLRWTAVASPAGLDLAPGFDQAHLDLATSGPAGLVAAGTEWGVAGQRPIVLFSSDGRHWERPAEPLLGSGPRALVVTDSSFLLAGAANAPGGQGPTPRSGRRRTVVPGGLYRTYPRSLTRSRRRSQWATASSSRSAIAWRMRVSRRPPGPQPMGERGRLRPISRPWRGGPALVGLRHPGPPKERPCGM